MRTKEQASSVVAKSSLGVGKARLRASYRNEQPQTTHDEGLANRVRPTGSERLRQRQQRPVEQQVEGQELGGYTPISVEKLRSQIAEVTDRAKDERLESAVPLVEALRMALALDRATYKAPPGTLTVKGWESLLKNWEGIIQKSRSRQMVYARAFFDEIAQDVDYAQSPLSALLHQLVIIINATLEQKGQQAA
uniref:Uncharacterized protein n=1 Tax=Magnetococcus massalia (strain MO-1) TaxID=451514 RepID=A0A1S7LE16_MAGMO|nr:Conserved protein of unknown function [Candidatus Magnetococcus massalia]